MNIFQIRKQLIQDYQEYVQSFLLIKDKRIKEHVEDYLKKGELWPEPFLQMNPSFEHGKTIDELVDEGLLHPDCRKIFRIGKESQEGRTLRLHKHQEEAIRVSKNGKGYVLTTGTGSGKSLAYIIPIVDHILRKGSGKGIQAIVVYPMNALANSQMNELEKFLSKGSFKAPIKYSRYTGQENQQEREALKQTPPDILLTNYVMLELILTRWWDRPLIEKSPNLAFLVLDELHTYRGRQGADVALLVRRVKETFNAPAITCVGTSATLAGAETIAKMKEETARVASLLFGQEIPVENVIGETLRRSTDELNFSDLAEKEKLKNEILQYREPNDLDSYYKHILSSWIETVFGTEREPESGLLKRRKPRPLTGQNGAAMELAELTGLPESTCLDVLERHLLTAYRFSDREKNNQPPFAFRLHQFFSRGDHVYATLEPPDIRYITVKGQQFVPGDRSRSLFPLVFCRECGTEFYLVKKTTRNGKKLFEPRMMSEFNLEEGEEPGFLCIGLEKDWNSNEETLLSYLPDDMLTSTNEGELKIKKTAIKYLPQKMLIQSNGEILSEPNSNSHSWEMYFFPSPFRFCPYCGVSYTIHSKLDYGKLATLGTEGRSSVITLLSISMVRELRNTPNLTKEAKKLLSFTDNRQDASLQAGHFNDFVQVGYLRSALYKAVSMAGPGGLAYDQLVQKVFDALDLPFKTYAKDPELQNPYRREKVQRALREVIGYRIYRDLERGWRLLLPNLEQVGLLKIEYQGLEEISQQDDIWKDLHPALSKASPETRGKVCKVLLDVLRKSLAINTEYLNPNFQDSIRTHCREHLKSEEENPWTIGEGEKLYTASIAWPFSNSFRNNELLSGGVFLSGKSGFGQYLRRPYTFPHLKSPLTAEDGQRIILELMELLQKQGFLESEKRSQGNLILQGYRLKSSALIWKAGDGEKGGEDPIRIPKLPKEGLRANPFFVRFYREVGFSLRDMEAREHTAQIPSEERERREKRFGSGELPVLYASATLELGVDIKELNAVNLRNVPPTPANYAQRCGRAGRNGQPALVFTYCSTYRSHDQYFFRRPLQMVAGAVTPPRIDLTNEDLLASHIHAIWLSESKVNLGSNLDEVVDTSNIETLPIQDSICVQLSNPSLTQRAEKRVEEVLKDILHLLKETLWYRDGWIHEVLERSYQEFDKATQRWRTLYRAAKHQIEIHHRVINDHARPRQERERSKRLRAEAEAQLELLTSTGGRVDSDFYTYRYYASEGFLPGYNFPRLPLSAYIPGKRSLGISTSDQFVSRGRFLAIEEFGPRAIFYHDGSRYRIERVLIPTNDTVREELLLPLRHAKICDSCGYLHLPSEGIQYDRCELCGSFLSREYKNLFRMENVATTRIDRINADEEERSRLGYEITTSIRFSSQGTAIRRKQVSLTQQGHSLAMLSYGPSAVLWRINRGWRKLTSNSPPGFLLDVERGYWARNTEDDQDRDPDLPLGRRQERVIPYVEDRKNCLIFKPEFPEDLAETQKTSWMATLEAALRTAIREVYELEDAELASEPLPNRQEREYILIYEASEGGAGVLRQLMEHSDAIHRIAQKALEICHYTSSQLQVSCEAACYDCLLNYSNQPDHRLLDRSLIRPYLEYLSRCEMVQNEKIYIPEAQVEKLLSQSGSELEAKWVRFLANRNLRLPDKAQHFIKECNTRPDFLYTDPPVAIYVDGPVHQYPDRAKRDQQQSECLEALGFTVIRFPQEEDWERIVQEYPALFGRIDL
jgi:ATP-dependent helicase YprA (DUF1998 family)